MNRKIEAMRILTYFLIIVVILLSACQRDQETYSLREAPFLNEDTHEIDSLIAVASPEEKIGQLILLQASPGRQEEANQVLSWYQAGMMGSLFCEQLPTERFIYLRDSLSTLSSFPNLNFTRQQILLNNHFSNSRQLPTNLTFSGLANDSLRISLEDLYFQEAKMLGINAAFFDLNLMGDAREKPFLLSRLKRSKESQLIQMASTLPLEAIQVLEDSAFLASPFREELDELMDYGLGGIVLDEAFFQKNDLSSQSIRTVFRGQLQFGGLIVGMVTNEIGIEKALAADVDLLLVRDDPQSSYQALLASFYSGGMSLVDLDNKLQRVLLAGKWAGEMQKKIAIADQPKRMASNTVKASILPNLKETFGNKDSLQETRLPIDQFMENSYWEFFSRQIYENVLTVVRPELAGVPFSNLSGQNFQLVTIDNARFRVFEKYFSKYADFTNIRLTPGIDGALPEVKAGKKPATYLFLLDAGAVNATRDSLFLVSLERLSQEQSTVLVHFGDPQRLAPFEGALSLVQIPERNATTEELTAQLVFGGVAARGRLPVWVNQKLPVGIGQDMLPSRLSFDLPQSVAIAPEKLVGIDAIANTAIQQGAMPGCQVAVAKGGKIIYSKAFGYQDYTHQENVQTSDLYDVASLTKVAATTLVAMQLFEDKKYDLNDRLKEHLTVPKNSTIRNIYLRSLFTHESGLQANMPVVPFLLYRDQPNDGCDSFYCKNYSEDYPVQIADEFYFKKEYLNQIWEKVHELPLSKSKRYRYSDVNFILIQKMLEEKTGIPLDVYIDQHFYQPLGLRNTTFRPLNKHLKRTIVPTQNDNRWRHQTLRGYVHDETAALLGGVAGHAGLFSNAEELAVIFQMLLNGGAYGGQQFLKAETIDLFTSNKYSKRRGLGFDRTHPDSHAAYSRSASDATYGHTGFTGTCVWTDPENDLVFVFLSNRLNPDVKNKKLFQQKVRERIHQVVYDALDSYDPQMPELLVTP